MSCGSRAVRLAWHLSVLFTAETRRKLLKNLSRRDIAPGRCVNSVVDFRYPYILSITGEALKRKQPGATDWPPRINDRVELFGDAFAFHTFQQLRQVPDLLVAGDFAILQVDRAVLQVERTLPQVQPAGQLANELVHVTRGIAGERFTFDKANGAGIGGVDILPV